MCRIGAVLVISIDQVCDLAAGTRDQQHVGDRLQSQLAQRDQAQRRAQWSELIDVLIEQQLPIEECDHARAAELRLESRTILEPACTGPREHFHRAIHADPIDHVAPGAGDVEAALAIGDARIAVTWNACEFCDLTLRIDLGDDAIATVDDIEGAAGPDQIGRLIEEFAAGEDLIATVHLDRMAPRFGQVDPSPRIQGESERLLQTRDQRLDLAPASDLDHGPGVVFDLEQVPLRVDGIAGRPVKTPRQLLHFAMWGDLLDHLPEVRHIGVSQAIHRDATESAGMRAEKTRGHRDDDVRFRRGALRVHGRHRQQGAERDAASAPQGGR